MNTHQMYHQANAQWQPVMDSSAVPYQMLQATSCQQVPTHCVIVPMQHRKIPPLCNYPSEDYTSHQSQRMISTSEEEEETRNNSKNVWNVIRRT